MSEPPTHELHGACLAPPLWSEARMNETDAAAYQPGPVFRTRMNKGRAQCEECGEWLDDCRCVDYVPERRRRESLSSRLAALEAENKNLRQALAPFSAYAQANDADPNCAPYPDPCPVGLRPGGGETGLTLGDLRRARAVWEKAENETTG